jgi:hypothetical protein
MGELNIIAAILTVRPLNDISLPTAIHIDPVRNIAVQTVTLYERIIEELRERGHGRAASDLAPSTASEKLFAALLHPGQGELDAPD